MFELRPKVYLFESMLETSQPVKGGWTCIHELKDLTLIAATSLARPARRVLIATCLPVGSTDPRYTSAKPPHKGGYAPSRWI